MMGYNSGWCNSCNCSSCDCCCGRKTVLQQSVSSCCGSSSTGVKFCKEPITFLTSNFIVLDANTQVQIKVSNSARLYVGQGIQIGDSYFQVTEIENTTTIKIAHNGTATPGANFTAINATYGCYQYPIFYPGIVELAYEPTEVAGLDAAFAEIADSVVDPVTEFTYGYLGPNKIQFNLEITCEIANTPEFISVTLPNAELTPEAVFSAVLIDADVPSPLVAYKKDYLLIIGPGSGTAFTNGTDLIIKVSGEYGV